MIADRNPSRWTRALAAPSLCLMGILCVCAASWLGLQACSIAASDLIATLDRRPLLKSLRDTVIIPASERFTARAAALETAARKLAESPGPELLDSAKTAWKEAALAWGSLQAIRLGPIADATARIDFWPTRPNLIGQALADSYPLDSARMVSLTPAAAKGLPALEWLLFSSPPETVLGQLSDSAHGTRRGLYLAAVASDLRRAAEGIHADWQGKTGAALVAPAADTRYPTTQMAVEELIKGLVATLEEMKTGKVLTPAGSKSEGKAQPDAVESPYASLSLEILRANLSGVEAAFHGNGGTGLDDYLKDLGSDAGARVDVDMLNAKNALEAVPSPLSGSVIGQNAKVLALGAALTDLVVDVKNDVASTLGFNITFTDNDGD
ncbi:MAG: imelysin family protein [Fibrobacteria bacterium]